MFIFVFRNPTLIIFLSKLPIKWLDFELKYHSNYTKCLVIFSTSYGDICSPKHVMERHDKARYVTHSVIYMQVASLWRALLSQYLCTVYHGKTHILLM